MGQQAGEQRPVHVIRVRCIDRRPDVELSGDLSELAQEPTIRLLGPRPHTQLPGYIKSFDVGIVPYVSSEYTANVYPTKLNEYLAMGIPVVATRVGGVPGLLRDGEEGQLVPYGDEAALAAALGRVLARESSVMAALPRARARAQTFSVAAVARLLEGVYERLLADASPH